MAFFGSNYYEAEPGVYLSIPYYSCYDPDPDPDPFVGDYDSGSLILSAVSYSISTVSQSKAVVYDPAAPYGGGYGDPLHTQVIISYNKTAEGFNEPDFEEYDPTPYGGGYDIAQTYGKPLLPSDEICYPRDAPPSSDSLPSLGKEEDHAAAPEPQKGSQPIIAAAAGAEQEQEQEQEHGGGGGGAGDVPESGYDDGGHGEPPPPPMVGSSQSGETEGNWYDDYYPWTGYDQYECWSGGNDGHGYEKREIEQPQAPWGYTPEAMEFCEGIFGHWPCLYRPRNHGRHQGSTTDHEERNSNQLWEGTADFLFGSSYPYTHQRDEEEGGGHGDDDAVPAYQKHYQEPTHYYLQVEDENNPWLQKFNIF